MKYFLMGLMGLFLPLTSFAGLTEIHANCWDSAADNDGTFLCQYVFIGARENGAYIYPELRAPDGEGEKSLIQADLACKMLGFRYATRFELENAKKETRQIVLKKDGGAYLESSSAPFIQHLNCY